jgi:MoaA/NifB/PqqE/SkfB family radical SAM enzyme
MREVDYRTFSLRVHKKKSGLKKPNLCQFELTFGCGLHCKHCYISCYNKPSELKKELNARQIKFILNKVYDAGIVWLCFTGGDPLTRSDFLEIYSNARKKGFLITIFTNGYSMSKETSEFLKKNPPFAIEITLNAVTEDTYEEISQVKGSFKRVMRGVDLILKTNLPLKIKTQITKDNLRHVPEVRKFIEDLGLSFHPSCNLNARLNGDLGPCRLRVSAEDILRLSGKKLRTSSGYRKSSQINHSRTNNRLFKCAVADGGAIYIDPRGNALLCNLIRKPSLSLLKSNVSDAINLLLPVTNREFSDNSTCKACELREDCRCCPGMAFVETANMESPLKYYCKLSRVFAASRR